MKTELTDAKIITTAIIVLILLFGVLVAMYLSSLSPSGESYTVTINSFHNGVVISFYNPIIIGETVVNKGLTPIQLPRGNYTIKAELYRDYSAPITWTKSFTLNRDMEIKVFD